LTTKDGVKNVLSAYPFTYFICFLTYSLILFIEKVAFNSHALIEHDHGDGHGHGHGDGHYHGPGHHEDKNEDKKSKIELNNKDSKGDNCKIIYFIEVY
jgi:hypothetical protein